MIGLESGRVVVGLPDEGPASIDTLLATAADLHRQRNTATTLVHAMGSAYVVGCGPDEANIERQQRSHQLLHVAARQLVSRVGYRARIETTASTTAPADELVNQSHSAALVLLMRRAASPSGHRVRRASITSAVSARAVCPVLVLRSGAPVPSSGPVVVGISAARSSIMAIAAAFDEASWRRCELVAVHAWVGPDLGLWSQALVPGRPAIEAYERVADLTQDESAVAVAEALAGQSERYPEVTVQHVLDTAAPIEALMRSTDGAQLVVVSRHLRSPHVTAGLGTIARGLLLRSRCPVMVTPSSSERLVGDPRPTPGVPVLPVMSGMAPRW